MKRRAAVLALPALVLLAWLAYSVLSSPDAHQRPQVVSSSLDHCQPPAGTPLDTPDPLEPAAEPPVADNHPTGADNHPTGADNPSKSREPSIDEEQSRPPEPEAPEPDVQVDLEFTIEGRVVDDQGNPVPLAEVYINVAETVTTEHGTDTNLTRENSNILIGRTDSAGRFVAVVHRMFAEGARADVNIWAKAEGFDRSKMATARLYHGDVRDDIVIVLRQHGTISGRVVDQDGIGIEGLNVVLGGFLAYMYEGRRKYPPEYLEAGNDRGSGRVATTDAQGAYEFRGVRDGRHAVHISRAAGWRLAQPYTHVADVQPGEVTVMPDHVLVRAACLTFVLVDADGTPLPPGTAAGVTLRDQHLGTQLDLSITTWSDGRFARNEPPAGNFQGEINVKGFRTVTVALSVVEGSLLDLGTLVLEAE